MSYDNISLAQKVEALNIKLSDLQREVAGLRQDVRNIVHLLREQKRQSKEELEVVAEQPATGETSLVD